METIKERVLQIAEKKGVSKESFFTKIGMSSANFRGKAKETPLNSNAIIEIVKFYPEVNLHWLITGEGLMFLETIKTTTIGERIKQLRVSNKFTQKEFSNLLGIKQATISQIETGVIEPSLNIIKGIVFFFNTSYSWLLDGKNE